VASGARTIARSSVKRMRSVANSLLKRREPHRQTIFGRSTGTLDTLQEPQIPPAFHAAADARPVARRHALDGMRVIPARELRCPAGFAVDGPSACTLRSHRSFEAGGSRRWLLKVAVTGTRRCWRPWWVAQYGEVPGRLLCGAGAAGCGGVAQGGCVSRQVVRQPADLPGHREPTHGQDDQGLQRACRRRGCSSGSVAARSAARI